jgi:hypothetical protein
VSTPEPPRPTPPITPGEYAALRSRVFGTANPERQVNRAWEWMVRTLQTPYAACLALGETPEYRVREPYWCFQRMGATRTDLPDGRALFVAGEHEDFYDPDFCIYNGVVVLRPSAEDRARWDRGRAQREEARRRDEEAGFGALWEGPHDLRDLLYGWGGEDGGEFGGEVEIYGYPREVFPPTDFHTATLVGGRVILIGRLGYGGERTPGVTPVMALDVATPRIEPLATVGDAPGWIYEHEATLDDGGASITVRGGKVVRARGEAGEEHAGQLDEHRLHLADLRWEKLTDRSAWRQFGLRTPDGSILPIERLLLRLDLGEFLEPACAGAVRVPVREPSLRAAAARVGGVVVRLMSNPAGVDVRVEGELDGGTVARLVEDVQRRLGAAYGVELGVTEVGGSR